MRINITFSYPFQSFKFYFFLLNILNIKLSFFLCSLSVLCSVSCVSLYSSCSIFCCACNKSTWLFFTNSCSCFSISLNICICLSFSFSCSCKASKAVWLSSLCAPLLVLSVLFCVVSFLLFYCSTLDFLIFLCYPKKYGWLNSDRCTGFNRIAVKITAKSLGKLLARSLFLYPRNSENWVKNILSLSFLRFFYRTFDVVQSV